MTVSTVDGTTKQITVTINGTDDKAAIAGTAVGAVTEDKLTAAGGKLDITDPDAGQARFVPQTGAAGAHGSFTVQPDGTWSYALDNGQPAVQALKTGDQITDTLTVSTVDGTTKQITVTINGTDDKAVISGVSTGTVKEDDHTHHVPGLPVTINTGGRLTVTDADSGEDNFGAAQLVLGTLGGHFVLGASGTWSYAIRNDLPAVQQLGDGETATDTATIHSADGTAHQITVTIQGTNDAPVLTAATASATEDGQSVTGQMSATDVDTGDTLSFAPANPVPGFTLGTDGSWSFDPTDAAYQHLAAGATQQVTIPVTVTDKTGATDTENLVITVTGTNDGPAVSGPVALPGGTEDKPVQITAAQLLEHATDIDTGDTLSVTGLSASHGSISGDAATGFTFTPDANYNGPVALSYQVTDGHGGPVAQTAALTLAATGDAAVIGGVDTGSVTEGTAGQDMSPDYAQPGMAYLNKATLKVDGQLTIIDPDAGEAEFDGKGIGFNYQGQFGDLLLNPDGSWHYNADAGGLRFVGGRPTTRGTAIDQLGDGETLTDTITVHSKDGTPHDIVITIHGSNDRPYCSSEVVLRPGTEDTRQTLTSAQLVGNTVDVDANDAGKLAIANLHPDHGSILDNKDGTYIFTPEKDYNGTVHFTYDVKDAHGGVTHTGATTSLAAVGDVAVITGTDTGAATEDHVQGRIVINGLLSVSDPDGPSQEHFQYSQFGETAVSDPFGGNLHIDSAGGWSYVTYNSNAAIQQLAAGEDGHATYRVRSTDGTTHQIHITIHGTNDTPVLSAATASATEDGKIASGQMSATDVDHGDTQAYSLGQAAPAGFTLSADGSWSFDPTDAAYQHLTANATQQITVPVTVTDSAGETDTQNLVITVTGTNDGPVVSGPVSLPGGTEDKPVQITAAQLLEHATDIDTGDTLSVTGLSASHGSISGDAATGFTFTPDANYNGPVALSYSVTDGQGGTASQTASLALTATGDAAIIGGVDTGSVIENAAGVNMSPDYAQPGIAHLVQAPLYVDGQLTIIDPDAGENSFDTHGVGYNYSGKYGDLLLQANGAWHYLGNAGNIGKGGFATTHGTAIDQLGESQTLTDTITVHAKDGTPHDIVITIHGSNDRPYCSSEVVLPGGTEDTRQTLTTAQLLQNSVDVDKNDAGTLSIANLRSDHGSILDNGNGTFTFTPEHDYNGAVHFNYDVKDAHSGVTHTGASTTLAAVKDSAVITGTDTGSATEDHVAGRIVINGMLSVSDPDGAAQEHFQYSQFGEHAVSDPFGGNLHITSAGSWSYVVNNSNSQIQQLAEGQVGHATYRVASVDGTTHQIEVTITGTNDAPVLSAASASATEDGTQMSGQMSATDVDTGDSQSYSLVQAAPAGFAMGPDGSWTFDPTDAAYQHLTANATQQITVPVTVTDSAGVTDTQNLVITVTGTNDGPVVSGRVSLPGGTEDHAVSISVAQLLEHATDIDTGDTLSVSGLSASHGTITGDAAHGFTFTPDANYNGPVQLSYSVTDGQGGTASQTASLALAATGDAAIIGGVDTGSVTEDKAPGHHSIVGTIATSGALTITDVDGAAQEHFQVQSNVTGSNGYGNFGIDQSGHWTYSANNQQAAIQTLGPGQSLTDTLQVTSTDGTTHNIEVTIHGTIDTPTLGATVGTSQSQPGHASAFVAGSSASSPATIDGMTIHGFAAGQAYETSPGKLADLTGAAGIVGTNLRAMGVDAKEPSAAASITQSHASPQSVDSVRVDPTDKTQQLGETMVLEFHGTTHSAFLELTSFGGQGDKVTWKAYGADGSVVAQGEVAGDQSTNPSGRVDLPIQTQQPFAFIAIHAEVPNPVATSHGSAQFTTNVSLASVQAELIRFATPLDLSGGIGDTGDKDQSLVWRVEGLQQAELSAGTRNPDGSWTVTQAEAQGLQMLHSEQQHVQITSIATDAGTGEIAQSAPLQMTVDPAGAKYSVITGTPIIRTDEDHAAPVTGDLDVDSNMAVVPTFVAGTQHTQYGTFQIDTDGHWSFTVDTAKAQGLSEHGIQEHLTVTTTDGSSLDMTVDIAGQNDPGVMTNTTGSGVQGPASVVGGKLVVTDVDTTGGYMFLAGSKFTGNVQGQFGTLDMDQNTGEWTYTVDPTLAAHIPAGQTAEETFSTLSLSSSEHTRLNLTLHVAVDSSGLAKVLQAVTAADVGTVKEDSQVQAGDLVAVGSLSVVNGAQDHIAGIYHGTYGELKLDANGHWSYEASNGQSVIQELKTGEQLTDQISVTGASGQLYNVAITIEGTDDAPVLSAASASATEDGTQVSGQMSATDVDTGDSQSYSLVQAAPAGFAMGPDGSWTFDPTDAAYQHLTANATQQITVPVTVTDSAGVTDTQNLVITVTGTNDGPVVSGRVSLPGGTEDHAVSISVAQLLEHATDIDTGDTLSVSGLSASHGTITGDAAHGFTFTPDANYNGPVQLSYSVTDGQGGTASQTASLALAATGDAAIIGGVDTGSVTEDKAPGHHSIVGTIATSGALTITDVDGAAQEHFQVQSNVTGSNGYGNFGIDQSGHWTYSANNQQAAIQTLGPGQSLTDTLQVTSTDGTTHNIEVTIHGTIDTPTLGATVGTSQSQPGHASAFVAGSSASSPATIDGMTIHGFAAGQAYETSPGKLADLTGAAGIVGTNLRAMGVDAKEPSAAASITQSHASPQYLDSVRVDPTDKTQQLGETMVLEFHGTTHSAFLELTSFGGQGDKVTWKAYGADGSVVAQGEVAGDQSTNPSGRVDLPIQTQQPFAFIAIHAEVPNPVATSSGSAQFTTNVSLASVQAELIRFATPLDLSGGIGDTGDTDQSLVWRVEGLQQAELSAGTHNPDGSWTVTQSEAQGLQILHSEQQHVQITSITTDAGTGEMAQSAPLQMTVDPAGAKYSVITGTPIIRTDEDHAAPVTGDLDVDSNMAVVPTFVAGTQHTQYGTFQIDTDGHWSFTVDTAKAQGLSQSGSQEHLTVTTTDGSSLDMTVDIAGDNDPGVMTNTTGSGVQGPASVVGGKLVVTDVDTTGGYMFLAGSKFTGNVQGQFGTLDMDQNTGEWTYTVDPTLAAQIPAGQTAEETFSTLSLSSSERTRLSLTLHVAVDSSGQAKVLQAVTASPAAPAPAPSADEPDLTDTSSFAVTLEPAVDGHDHDNPLLRSDMDDPAALQPRGPVDAAPAMASQHDAPEQVTPKDHEESGHQDGDTNLGHDANAPRAEQGVTDTAEHAVNIEEHSPHLEIEENSANAPGVHEGTGPEALDERLGESVHSPHDSDLLNPYLDAIGANQQSDTATPSQDYDHANPYITALGVDASMSTDAPVVDPTTLDDPVNAEVPNSDAASDHAEADLPPDDPIVPLPEDDDPSTNLG
ncbi:VCBS domain-containing protein [Pelagimonas varians]|uniref:VCBS domain-containing protein n=1 Tax=Pelagimonas varians TaxID=696760 RepID=UPI0020D10DD6|nr:VCBS domain-containing protein [Pelagimonas varians]